MSNTLITPVGLGLIARAGVLVLENNMVLGNMVNRQLDSEFRQVGDTINVRKYATFEAVEFATTTCGNCRIRYFGACTHFCLAGLNSQADGHGQTHC